MINSDVKETVESKTANSAETGVSSEEVAEKSHSQAAPSGKIGDGIGEYIALSIKAVAVALSLCLLVLSVLTVALPLQAMRVFNKLAMTERAIECGEQYVNGEMKSRGATAVDERGNFIGITEAHDLTNDDFVEALDVVTRLSDGLMRDAVKSNNARDVAYYAEKVEKYTRMYSSLSGVALVNLEKDENNIASVPMLEMRPYVYSNAHYVRVLNYRARVYLGETDKMLYSGGNGQCVTSLDDRSNTTYSYSNSGALEGESKEARIDEFVDYAAQLGENLSVEIDKLGLGGIVLDEAEVRDNHRGILDGTQFSMFINSPDGYTRVYEQLKCFNKYAQAAYDFNVTAADNVAAARLKQLYWLNELDRTATKLYYMSCLLYYSADRYGASMSAIVDEYRVKNTCEMYMYVKIGPGDTDYRAITELYKELMKDYVNIFKA